MAQHTKDFLIKAKLHSDSKKEKNIECFVSDDPKKFNAIAAKIFNNFNATVKKINLDLQ
jgi:glutamate racemase